MFSKKLLMVLTLTVLGGSLTGATEPIKHPKPVCIPCTPYCKTHPNSPRCN